MSFGSAADQENPRLSRCVSSHLHSLSRYNNPFATTEPLDPSWIDAWGTSVGTPVHGSVSFAIEDSRHLPLDSGVRFEQDMTATSIPSTDHIISPVLTETTPGQIQTPYDQTYSFNDIPSFCDQPVGHSPLAWDQPITVESPPSARRLPMARRSTSNTQ